MLVLMIVMMVMAVAMRVTVAVSGDGDGIVIGAAFRIERRLDMSDFRAKAAQHALDDVIGANENGVRADFRREVPIADMPCNPHEMQRVAAADFHQRFGRGADSDDETGREPQRIAAAQIRHLREVEQELHSLSAFQHHAAAVTILVIENDIVRRFPLP